MFGAQLAQTLHVVDDVVVVHDVGLVAVDDDPFALIVTAHYGYAVSIGVGCYNEVSAQFCTQCHAHCHGFGVFGVRRHHGGEVAVDNHLLGNHVNVLEAPAAQAHRHYLTAGTVHRGIYDVKVFLTKYGVLVNHDRLDRHHIVIIHLAADDFNQVFIAFPFNVLDAHFVDLVNNALVVRLQHL